MSDCFDHEGDAIDDGLFGRTADEGASGDAWGRSPTSQCKYCGKYGLSWRMTTHGYRLVDQFGIHECNEYRKAKTL